MQVQVSVKVIVISVLFHSETVNQKLAKMFKTLFILTVFCLSSFCLVKSYRILGVFPVPTRSHYILGATFMKALAEAGHDVTIIAPFKEDQFPSLSKNGSYREIVLDGIEEAQKNSECLCLLSN